MLMIINLIMVFALLKCVIINIIAALISQLFHPGSTIFIQLGCFFAWIVLCKFVSSDTRTSVVITESLVTFLPSYVVILFQ